MNIPDDVSIFKSLDNTHATVLHEREGRPEIKQVRRPAKSRNLVFSGIRMPVVLIFNWNYSIGCRWKNVRFFCGFPQEE